MRLRAIRRLSTIWRGADRNVVMVGYLQYVLNGTGDNVALLADGRQSLEAVDHRPSQTGFELAGVVSQPLRKRKGSSKSKFGRQAARHFQTVCWQSFHRGPTTALLCNPARTPAV